MVIEEMPPELMFPERLTRLVAKDTSNDEDGSLECKEEMWWEGIEIIPNRPKLGLIGLFDDSDDVDTDDERNEYTSSNEEEVRVPRKKKRTKKRNCRLWQHNASARSNQDIQRAYEEVALKDMVSILNRRTAASAGIQNSSRPSKTFSRHVTPPGGIWVRLEAEWRDTNSSSASQRAKYGARTKSRK